MTVRIEIRTDGGIRVEAPGMASGLASVRMVKGWMQVAADRDYEVIATGDVNAAVAQSLLDEIRRDDVPITATPSEPAPWPRRWSSLQMAAASGLDEQVRDLLDRGAPVNAGRREQAPYRLAMRAGRVGVLNVLRDAGARIPPGSKPPPALPDAVVFRNYLPEFTRWFAIGIAVFGFALAVVLWQWAFLLVAVFGVVVIIVGNVIIGRTRIAIDGRRLSVRQFLRWQGPIDLGALVAVGYAPALSQRMSSRWRLVQTEAGQKFGPLSRDGFEPPLVDELKRRPDLRVVTVYSGRGFLSPGFARHLAPHVLGSSARLSTTAQFELGA